MPSPRTLSPSYRPKYRRQRFTKQRGKKKRADVAFVEIDGERTYLGEYGTPDSREKYDRIIAEWLQRGRSLPAAPTPVAQRTVAVIAAAYLKWAEEKYRNPDGSLRSRYQDTKDAIKPLIALYGNTPAEEMGPQKLLAIRQTMIERNLCRKTINERIYIIKRIFRKAIEFELMGPTVADKLDAVEGLAANDTNAKPSREVKPVAMEYVDAIRYGKIRGRDLVSRQVRAVMTLQLITNARPSELLNLRLCDLDMSGEAWLYRPKHHKTAHHNKSRLIAFGPKAQAILAEFVTGRATDKPLFSAREAEEERLAKLHAERETPLSCGNVPGSNRVANRKRQPRDHYDEASYRRAIQRACDAADEWAKGGVVIGNDERLIPRWHPYQIRHTSATRDQRELGWKTTQLKMGHSAKSAITTEYVEADESALIELALRAG